MFIFRSALTALALASTLALAACSSGQDNAVANQSASAGAPSTATGSPLTADQVNVQMTLQRTPTLSGDSKSIDVVVNLANNGKTTLSSAGPKPVHLGAHSADAAGKIVNLDLARAAIPDIAPDGQAVVTIQLPIDQVVGNSAQILPVQEGVAWFDTWGTKPLVVGPFSNCASPAVGKVCSADGKPVTPAAAN